MCIRKRNITALILVGNLNVGAGALISMEVQCKHNAPTLKERL